MSSLSVPYVLPRVDDPALELRKYANFVLALLDRRARSEVSSARPIDVTIDPSTLCQLSCPYCEVGNETIRRGKTTMKSEAHERVIAEIGESAFVAWYFSTGEPLLNKRFTDLLARTRGTGIFPVVSTNLSLPLSPERIDEILRCGLGIISISIDGASPETYVRYRVGGEFDLVVGNMRRLIERKRELGLEFPLIEWRFLVFRHNRHEVEKARRLAAEYGVDLLEFYPGSAPPTATDDEVQMAIEPWPGPPTSGPALERARARADSTLRKLLATAVELPPRAASAERLHRKCDWLYFGSTFFPSGTVAPCCLSNHADDDFGSMADGSSFADVWNNDRFRRARGSFTGGSAEGLVCHRCPNRDAQDFQFRTTLQAVLRNAPDWVLWLIAEDPHRLFLDIDFDLLPTELDLLSAGPLNLDRPTKATDHPLAGLRRRSNGTAELASWLSEALRGDDESLASSMASARLDDASRLRLEERARALGSGAMAGGNVALREQCETLERENERLQREVAAREDLIRAMRNTRAWRLRTSARKLLGAGE